LFKRYNKRSKRKKFRKTTDVHHFYQPKHLYSEYENTTSVENYEYHHEYHRIFEAFCKDPKGRLCTNCAFL